jgi:DNA (cytosine-5)-methyltransferase 1
VFVVGHLGDWRRAAAVLFERESMLGNSAPSRQAGQAVAATLTRGAESGGKGGYAGRRQEDDVNIVVARALTTSNQRIDAETETETETLIVANTLRAKHNLALRDDVDTYVPFTLAIRGCGDGHNLEYRQDGTANAVLTPNGGRAGIGVGAIAHYNAVRRLTPRECLRLQGFPDNYLDVLNRGKPAADGPKYKAVGNSMAIPPMHWIGSRIQLVEETLNA